MCHIFHCITLALDLLQRLITYLFACFISIVVFLILLASLIVGMTYGYKHYMAEYYTMNRTGQEIRQIHIDEAPDELVEFDYKHYAGLKEHYMKQNATSDKPAMRKSLDTYVKVLPTDEETVTVTRVLTEDKQKETSTIVYTVTTTAATTTTTTTTDDPDVFNYIKKLNWILSNQTKTTIHVYITEPKKMLASSTSASFSDYIDKSVNKIPLRYLMPVNKMASKTKNISKNPGMQYFVDKLNSELGLKDNLRRTDTHGLPPHMKKSGATLTSNRKDVTKLRFQKHRTTSYKVNTSNTTTTTSFKTTTEDPRSETPTRTSKYWLTEPRSDRPSRTSKYWMLQNVHQHSKIVTTKPTRVNTRTFEQTENLVLTQREIDKVVTTVTETYETLTEDVRPTLSNSKITLINKHEEKQNWTLSQSNKETKNISEEVELIV